MPEALTPQNRPADTGVRHKVRRDVFRLQSLAKACRSIPSCFGCADVTGKCLERGDPGSRPSDPVAQKAEVGPGSLYHIRSLEHVILEHSYSAGVQTTWGHAAASTHPQVLRHILCDMQSTHGVD